MWVQRVAKEPLNEDAAFEGVGLGLTMLIAQGVVVTNPFFSGSEIQKYLKIRKAFHPYFSKSCSLVADALEGTPFQAASVPLRRVGGLSPRQMPQAFRLTVQAFRGLGRLRYKDIRDTKVFRIYGVIHKTLGLLQGGDEDDEYWRDQTAFRQLFEAAIKLPSIPPPLKTLFRKLLKMGGGASDFRFSEESNPGAWFDMPAERRVAIRKRMLDLDGERLVLSDHYSEDPEGTQRRWKEIAQEKADLQGEAGVSLVIMEQKDQEPLDRVLLREGKLNADGPTVVSVDQLRRGLVQMWEEYPTQRRRMFSKRELRKLLTQIDKVRTLSTLERVIREAVDRGLISDSVLEDVTLQMKQVSKNKAVRDGVPLLPLTWKPTTKEEFQERHDTGDVVFSGDWTEEQRQEMLGKVSRAISDLEPIFGEGFCGKHAKKLAFRFYEGSGVGSFASASYFGWEDRGTWQPRVKFGQDFEGLLAHELSHFMDDMLAFQMQKATGDMPEYQYGDVAHGSGDLFGSTGVPLDWFVEKETKQKEMLQEHFPEMVELMEVVVSTPDYARWKDHLGVAYETALPKAIKNVTGQSYWDFEEGETWVNAKYKSELPPEIVAEAERVYKDLMGGDTRKLHYVYSGVEVWARICEQYVYTRLSGVGIANPWLTRLTYDVDVNDQFVEEKTFVTQIQPILDRLFARLKEHKVLARLVQAYRGFLDRARRI